MAGVPLPGALVVFVLAFFIGSCIQTGNVVITSEPLGATIVTAEGHQLGTTPLTLPKYATLPSYWTRDGIVTQGQIFARKAGCTPQARSVAELGIPDEIVFRLDCQPAPSLETTVPTPTPSAPFSSLPTPLPLSPGAGGEARTALVIGNARYLTSPLRTPQNDARALHVTLRDLGFDVTLVENGRRRDLITAIEAFGGTLRQKGGVGLLFYAGHGVQIKGKNYLIPVDAQVHSEVTAVAETVDVELVLGAMAESGTRINVLILDACRNNPFERRWRGRGSGLAPITVSDAKGTLIAYSTDPGKTAEDGNGAHSPYAQALLEVLRVPNLTIEQVFKRVREKVQAVTAGTQTPWETSSLTGEDFFFSRR